MIELAERIQTENKELGTQIMGSRLALLSRSVSRFVFPFLEKNYVENFKLKFDHKKYVKNF